MKGLEVSFYDVPKNGLEISVALDLNSELNVVLIGLNDEIGFSVWLENFAALFPFLSKNSGGF